MTATSLHLLAVSAKETGPHTYYLKPALCRLVRVYLMNVTHTDLEVSFRNFVLTHDY